MRIALYFFMVVVCCTACSKKKASPPPPAVKPAIKIENSSQERLTAAAQMHFTISLDKTTNVPVSVNYTLQNGTATAPKDYTSASGTITIPPNQARADLSVRISGDPTNTREDNLEFSVVLSNPQNGSLATATAKGIIITENGTNFVTADEGYTTPTTYPGYTLAWSDEFSGNSLNDGFWNYETGNGSGGWGNNELEYYTNSTKNVFVSNGNLIIEARKEATGNFSYTSARLTTQNKKNFQYGRVDIRAKLPKGKGIWPALWMLGSNINTTPWPGCGEIDIMELLGHEPSKTYSTLHYGTTANHGSNGNSYTLSGSTFYDKFHVFSMIWIKDSIKVYVDENPELEFKKSDVGSSTYPFNAPFFFIFNVAVGGNWPGNPDATTQFPQRMIVDYIRVFQQ